MGDATREFRTRLLAGRAIPPSHRALNQRGGLLALITPLAQPRTATLVALFVYMVRAAINPQAFQPTATAYFNYLADAFIHGQLYLRLDPASHLDLILHGGRTYLYWPPFPALLLAPVVALFGVGVSDVLYTVIFAALSLGLLANFLDALNTTGIAPLAVEYRAILVASCGFGSVLMILAPVGTVWFTAQVIGWACVLYASIAALLHPSPLGYFLTGLALSCAVATRLGLVFTGVWLAYYLLRRDWQLPLRDRLTRIICGLLPLILTLGLPGWYNAARFGQPLEMRLAWHNFSAEYYAADFASYGVFNLHYLPINLYHHFVIFPYVKYKEGIGSGLFWMTPILIGGLYALWHHRRDPMVWALGLSCLLVYAPIGLIMGTGYAFGSRYLLDLLVPLVALTALGIRRWRLDLLQLLMIIGWVTFVTGSALYLFDAYLTRI
jgi:hypothetical protein